MIASMFIGQRLHSRKSVLGARKVVGSITLAQLMFGGPIVLFIVGIAGGCFLVIIGVFAPFGGS
jgi:uncharacterized membrane protein YjjP (DUF1212 family)